MWKLLLSVILFIQIATSHAGRRGCGGTFTAARGILTTPNFPGPFKVPIWCQWVIDASNMVSSNTSIIVYLTQMFTFEGLTFTEYQLYGSDYKINPKLIHKVNETNITKTKWIQTYQSYLVIELKMQSAESAHLRVLDKFLDIYGFNITYEISTNGVRNPSCTMMDCGFTGVCYDHYTKFTCSCFDGYSGPNCSEGPKSFCYTNNTPTCKNGGTCLHVGVAAVKCHCSKLFTGNICETSLETAAAKDCPNCHANCSYDGKLENACKCLTGKSNASSQTGLFATLHLGNLPNLEPVDLKYYIKTQLLRQLRANVSRIEDLKILSLIHYMSATDVSFQVYGLKGEERKIKNVLNKWADRGYVGNITVAEKDNSIKTPLSIQSVDINQPGVIRENDEFILSCVARGSPSITFRWFKDGIFINLTYVRHKWIKLIKDPHVTDQYTALLAVERAQKYDEGKFTCQVEDFNMQQCKSKFVKVRRRPLVKIEPMSLTVRKRQNVTVKCVTIEDNGSIGGKYTYSWTKNKELLPVRTDTEKYETLYPAGTILQIFHVEKDISYSCLVQDSVSSSEKSIHVYVLDREDVHTCPLDVKFDLIWLETAPDTDSIQECPKEYTGVVTRRCGLRDGRTPSWEVADFSQCTHNVLNEIYYKFQQFKLGYASITLTSLLKGFLNYVLQPLTGKLRPGEGTRILVLIQEVQSFLSQAKIDNVIMQNISRTIFSVVDRVCLSPDALIRSHDINLVQKTIYNQVKILRAYVTEPKNFENINASLNTFDLTVLNENPSEVVFYIPAVGRKLGFQSIITDKTFTTTKRNNFLEIFVVLLYKNLSAFFSTRSFLRLRDGTETEYQIYSQISSFLPVLQNQTERSEATVTVDFQHNFSTDKINSSVGEQWEVKCGYTNFESLAYTWDIDTCVTDRINDKSTRCICPKYRSYAVLLVLSQSRIQIVPKEPHKYILMSSFFLCIILTLCTTICLGTSCFLNKRSCLIILKLQCSLSICLCEVLFAFAVLLEPPQQYLMFYLTFLEMFLLLGISSHLSKLLIIFTELIDVPKSITSKYTVIGITSGVPLITIFGNHFAFKTMDISLKSWWMIENSLAFNIFLFVVFIITALFIFIYLTIVKKLKDLIITQEKHEKIIKKRISLIRRTGCLFFALIVFTISSIIYINNQKLMWSIYQFSGINVLLGIMVITCYILYSETEFKSIFRKKTENKDAFFSIDLSGPLHFVTKQETDCDNQSRRPINQQISMKSLDTTKFSVSKTQSITNAFGSCLQTSSNFCDVNVDDNSTSHGDKNQSLLEKYNSSPPTLRRPNTHTSFTQSPDILTAKPCVGLDLVASSMCANKSENQMSKLTPKTEKKSTEHKVVRIMFPPQVIITPDNSTIKPMESDSAVQTERTQPDGHDDMIPKTETTRDIVSAHSISQEPSSNEDNLDGVLNSISHDLDYLLNRNDNVNLVIGSPSTSRRLSKSSGVIVSTYGPDKLAKDESAVLEEIMLRTNL